MQETILIASDRKTGKDVLLCGREVPFPEQRERYEEFNSQTHEEYSSVALVYLQPAKKPLQFLSEAEVKSRAEKHDQLVATSNAKSEAKDDALPKNLAQAKQALTDAESACEKANQAFQAAKKAFGISADAAEKHLLHSKMLEAKKAARLAISELETARQEFFRMQHEHMANPPAEPETPNPKPEIKREPTPGEKREAELLKQDKSSLLAMVEKLKAEGKTIDAGKGTKSALVTAILKAEGFDLTVPETAE